MNILDIYTGEYKISMVKEHVKKNWTIMSVGESNGNFYSKDELAKGLANTVWDKNSLSLFADHTPYETGSWAGKLENPHMVGNDIKGDLYFYDLNLVNKLEAGAEFGISPELVGNLKDGNVIDITFQNFSVVFEPACKTTYLNSERRDNEIMIEQAVEREKGYFYFVNSDGSLCRRKLSSRGNINMVDKTKKLEDETKETEVDENTETTESKVESMLSEVLDSQKAITKRLEDLETEKPEETDEEKKKKDEKKDEELEDDKSEEVTKTEESEVKPEEAKLSADMYEALRSVNSDYAEFLLGYVSEHKTEGTIVELMEKSSIAFKASKKTLEDEDKKQKLQDNKVTVAQPDGDDEKKEITLRDVDMELAEVLINGQGSLTAGSL